MGNSTSARVLYIILICVSILTFAGSVVQQDWRLVVTILLLWGTIYLAKLPW